MCDDVYGVSGGAGRWTTEEHNTFVEGLVQWGRDWKKIAETIPTRTVVQIRTHAQKYFQKVAREKGLDTAEGLFRGQYGISDTDTLRKGANGANGREDEEGGEEQTVPVREGRKRRVPQKYMSDGESDAMPTVSRKKQNSNSGSNGCNGSAVSGQKRQRVRSPEDDSESVAKRTLLEVEPHMMPYLMPAEPYYESTAIERVHTGPYYEGAEQLHTHYVPQHAHGAYPEPSPTTMAAAALLLSHDSASMDSEFDSFMLDAKPAVCDSISPRLLSADLRTSRGRGGKGEPDDRVSPHSSATTQSHDALSDTEYTAQALASYALEAQAGDNMEDSRDYEGDSDEADDEFVRDGAISPRGLEAARSLTSFCSSATQETSSLRASLEPTLPPIAHSRIKRSMVLMPPPGLEPACFGAWPSPVAQPVPAHPHHNAGAMYPQHMGTHPWSMSHPWMAHAHMAYQRAFPHPEMHVALRSFHEDAQEAPHIVPAVEVS